MSSYHQKKLIGIATLVIYVFIILLGISYFGKDTEASNYTREGTKGPSESRRDYYPPRIQQLCYNNFIGTDWNTSMKYEKRCRVLWTAWTNEIKTSLPY